MTGRRYDEVDKTDYLGTNIRGIGNDVADFL